MAEEGAIRSGESGKAVTREKICHSLVPCSTPLLSRCSTYVFFLGRAQEYCCLAPEPAGFLLVALLSCNRLLVAWLGGCFDGLTLPGATLVCNKAVLLKVRHLNKKNET